MTTAITYIRVSTDEQSHGYSLTDQQDKLNTYCKIKQYQVVEHFSEDHSAKTFDRPTFKKLLSYLKQHKGKINKLVFLKWDRFSRNATEALIMIKQLKTLGVECEAMEQPLDLSIPENKLLLVIYLSTPEIENDRRSMNASNGMRRAMKEGRHCSTAPFGYKYTRDEKNKPLLIPDGHKADLVREAFELYCTGLYDKVQIRKMLAPKGMTLSRSRFATLFDNPIYAGKIVIPALNDEPRQVIDGVHRAIVSEALFQKA
ncbi:MAG: recombinase family protein [Bacteroidia bacterium]|nr:recombinase family protein [Bacteroidia bacterium]